MIDIEKFYRIAKSYVGNLNKDLVHHTFEKVHDKLSIAKDPEAYFYQAMRNQLRGDMTFRKHYDLVKAVDYEDEVGALFDIDPDRVNAILKEISDEGYRLEVKTFIEMSTDKSANELSKITGVRYDNLLKVRNFVRNEVIKRYGNIS